MPRKTVVFEIEIEVEASADVRVDPNWGSDTDGRRGQRMVFVGDVKIADDEWAKIKKALEEKLQFRDEWEDEDGEDDENQG